MIKQTGLERKEEKQVCKHGSDSTLSPPPCTGMLPSHPSGAGQNKTPGTGSAQSPLRPLHPTEPQRANVLPHTGLQQELPEITEALQPPAEPLCQARTCSEGCPSKSSLTKHYFRHVWDICAALTSFGAGDGKTELNDRCCSHPV